MSEKWYYPMTSIEFQDQEFNYFDFIHESLKNDEDVLSALSKLKNLETSWFQKQSSFVFSNLDLLRAHQSSCKDTLDFFYGFDQ